MSTSLVLLHVCAHTHTHTCALPTFSCSLHSTSVPKRQLQGDNQYSGLLLGFSQYFFKYVLLIVLLQFSQFSPLSSLCPAPPNPPPFPPTLSSCPWVVHISSSNSLFPLPLLTSPCLFYAQQLHFLFPVPFPPIPPHRHTENPPCDVHFSDSVPVLVVSLVFVF